MGEKAERDLLADAAAELYTADPDGFTGRRSELAAGARQAGDTATARQIAALRKPTRSAWVVNRLVREHPEVRDRLAGLGQELRAAAGGARIRELTAARARLVDELTRQALDNAGLPAPPAALREEVTATLDAAIADPDVAANLGMLARAAQWAGFGPAPDGGFPPPPPPPPPAKPTTRAAPADAAAERDRRRQEKIMEAERALAQAGQTVQAAAEAERDLEDTVRRLETELGGARQRLAEVRRQSYRAESRQRRVREELERLRR